MLTLEKRILQWKKWVNRNKQFSIEELEELENHLREEILYLTEHDKVHDHKAFDQALDILGEKGLLDEEFGKIRKSRFDKVKLWAYAQTFVIVGLVMVLIAPYVHIPKKEITDDLIGYQVGEVDDKNVINYSLFKTNSYVLHKNQTYYYNDFIHSVMSFGYDIDFSRPINFRLGSTDFFGEQFDIDSQKNFYRLNYGRVVSAYITRDNNLVRTIPLSDKLEPGSYPRYVKIIGKKLIVCVTQEAYIDHKSNKRIFRKVNADDFALYGNAEEIFSYLLVIDLESNQTKSEKITLKNIVMSMDRSEDEVALLLDNGKIDIYSIQNNKLTHKDSWKINDFDSYIAKNDYYIPTPPQERISLFFKNWRYYLHHIFNPSKDVYFYLGEDGFIHNKVMFIYCKTKQQMALMGNNFDFRYSYLKPTNNKELTILPLTDKNLAGLIKIGFLVKERLVLVKNNTKKNEYHDLDIYLFKD